MSKLSELFSKLKPLLSDKRVLAAIAGVLVLGASIIVMAQRDSRVATGKDPDKSENALDELLPGEAAGPVDASASPGAPTGSSARSRTSSGTGARPGVGVSVPKTGTIPPGIDYAKQTIKIVYYWGDSSRSSQYLPPGTAGDTVDDGKAFDALVKFVNKHAKGSAELMGSKINLGNWKIEPTILTMNDDAQINAGTTKITKEIKPFAAITARGSLGTETCPAIAAAGIYNYATNQPYMTNLDGATNGYCVSNGISWDQQIAATVNYMKWHKGTTFTSAERPGLGQSCPTGCARVYGFIYSEYPGLDKQAPLVVDKLRDAGVNIKAVASLPAGLSNAAGQASSVRNRMVEAGVNTVIMPDGGSSLAFTHGAGEWRPDYYVWPCSGQDTTGYTRLLPPAQWDNAAGLSCYDDTFDADLTIDSGDRNTQWYKAYKEMAPNSEAPSSTYLVYAALQPILEGVGGLGSREFTAENYRAALQEFQPYRYHGVNGKTTAADNIQVLLGNGVDNSLWGDLARVSWSPAAENPFTYIDKRRYTSNENIP